MSMKLLPIFAVVLGLSACADHNDAMMSDDKGGDAMMSDTMMSDAKGDDAMMSDAMMADK